MRVRALAQHFEDVWQALDSDGRILDSDVAREHPWAASYPNPVVCGNEYEFTKQPATLRRGDVVRAPAWHAHTLRSVCMHACTWHACAEGRSWGEQAQGDAHQCYWEYSALGDEAAAYCVSAAMLKPNELRVLQASN